MNEKDDDLRESFDLDPPYDPAGDVREDAHGNGPQAHVAHTYASARKEDPRIARVIHAALGDARSVVNVGAGNGAYEPRDLNVIAVEPSARTISQRPPDAAPALQGHAESLPLEAASVDAAMACLALHHWSDWRVGVQELRRVARRRIVLFTYDPSWAPRFWLVRDYLPRLGRLHTERIPTLAEQCAAVSEHARVLRVLIPHDCRDRFFAAHWRQPHAYLDKSVRDGISAFRRLPHKEVALALSLLTRDLRSGHWTERNRDLLACKQLDLGYRLIVAELLFDQLRD